MMKMVKKRTTNFCWTMRFLDDEARTRKLQKIVDFHRDSVQETAAFAVYFENDPAIT
jgi:calcineurin-like phosphoesterase